MLTVGIVNDLAIARHALKATVNTTPGFRVLWEAEDGKIAVDRHRAQPADIILLDLIMPVMDGVRATPLLMAVRPCAILVVTATVSGNRQMVFAAMSAGALDAVDTPGMRSEAMAGQLRRKLVSIGRLVQQSSNAGSSAAPGGEARSSSVRAVAPEAQKSSEPQKLSPLRPITAGPVTAAPSRKLRIIGIGASTGGPQAFATILRTLPADLDAAVVLVQHLDKYFVPGLQSWLQTSSALPVRLVTEDTVLESGVVYLAYTEDHMVLKTNEGGSVFATYVREPENTPHRPSVDTFFESLSALKSHPRLGVLLTGMGRDGAEGLLEVRKSGGATVVQDQASSVVFGMPRAALQLGAAVEGTALPEIGNAITAWMGSGTIAKQNPAPPAP